MMKRAEEELMNQGNDISFEPVVTEEQRKEVAQLAQGIWHEHYAPIIGENQVNYMIDKFQSEAAMKEQIDYQGYQYYSMISSDGIAGYLAIREDTDALFLSKLYIAKEFRGRNYARKAMNFIEQICKDKKLSKIWLTVNRHNENSISIYKKLGFAITRIQVADIGAGYVMDDYIMELIQ